ncbi:hypothetical protein [Corynebacterium aurimucosum]
MNAPTRQEIIDAHEALETLCARVPEETPAYAMKSLILSALPPRPNPTMADVEWDDDKHYLAEAEHPDFGKVIMLGRNAYSRIDFFAPERYASRFKDTGPENLTPTGKRYTLTEVQE